MWNALTWLLDVVAFSLIGFGEVRYSRRANKIPVPDLPEFRPGESTLVYLDTLALQGERYQERMALRRKAVRLNWVALAMLVLAVLISAIHLVAILA